MSLSFFFLEEKKLYNMEWLWEEGDKLLNKKKTWNEKIFCLKHAVFITHYNFVLLREKEQDHKQI